MIQYNDVFISYGRADSREFVVKLVQKLASEGLKIWVDFDDIPVGIDYQQHINDSIDKSHNFLFIISPHSVNSKYCKLEIDHALRRKKRIIPLLHVEEINFDTWMHRNTGGTEIQWKRFCEEGRHSSLVNMISEVQRLNWVYCREKIDDFEKATQELIADIKKHSPYTYQHTDLLYKSLEWERNNRLPDYLLIEEDCQRAESWLSDQFRYSQFLCEATELHCEFITESIKTQQNMITKVFFAYAE